MIGLFFILALAIYVGIAWFIVKALSSKQAKYTVIAIFVLIPTWDVVPGWLYLQHLCKTEGGVKIYKSVEDVEGFRFLSGQPSRDVFGYGYKVMEGEYLGKLYRYNQGTNDQWVEEQISEPVSKHAVNEIRQSLPMNIEKVEYKIFDVQTNGTLAVMRYFYHRGNWVQVTMSPLFGSGDSCSHLVNFKEFYINTLKPIKSKKTQGQV